MNKLRAIRSGMWNVMKCLENGEFACSRTLVEEIKKLGMDYTDAYKLEDLWNNDVRGFSLYDAEEIFYPKYTKGLYGKCLILMVNNGKGSRINAMISYDTVVAIIVNGELIKFDYHIFSGTTDRHLREFANWYNLDLNKAKELGYKKTEYVYNGYDIIR